MAFGCLAARALAGVGVCMLVALGGADPALAAPSSMKIGSAPLISPSAADAFYGAATTATNRTGWTDRPPEVKELARALKSDPKLIYEHVHDNMELTWTFGLTKGPVGVIVDRSGTAFDQASLMVELLRESGFTANYKLGLVSLTGAEFTAWSGISDAKAACQMLASGGIPAIINGSTTADCAYTGSVSSIQLTHIWVAATISGVEYLFDPARKSYSEKTGIVLQTAAGLTPGETLTGVSSSTSNGTEAGVGYTQNLNASHVDTRLTSYANGLQTAVTAMTSVPAIDDVVGGRDIVATGVPADPLPVSLSYVSTVYQTWMGRIPNQYRTRIDVLIRKSRPDSSTVTVIDQELYVDEIYGWRLIFEPNFDVTGAVFNGALRLLDEQGRGPTLASASYLGDSPLFSKGEVRLTVDMPYAVSATGGSLDDTYMDLVWSRNLTYALPLTIVHGWGDIGRGLVDKWGARRDTPMPPVADPNCNVCFKDYKATKGDGRRELLAASWLGQASQASRLHAQIAKAVFQQHYAIGVVSADTDVIQTALSGGYAYAVTDSFDRVDIDQGVSLTSLTADAGDRRAALHAIAATNAVLKGSVVAQVSQLPDVSSTATRFQWGNAPPSEEDPSGAGARRFYGYLDTTQAAQATTLAQVEGASSTSSNGVHSSSGPEIGQTELNDRRNQATSVVESYVNAGFEVVTSQEMLLGPGARGGGFIKTGASTYTHEPTKQRGGALVAVKYDVNRNPLEISHALVGYGSSVEGGGGGAQTYHQSQYDPATAADVIKGRYLMRPVGSIAAAAPAVVASGVGDFPYKLEAQLLFRDQDADGQPYGKANHRQPQGPWTTNWHNGLYLSGSGREAMGETDVRAAFGTLAAFLALQDVYRETGYVSPGVYDHAKLLRRDVTAQFVAARWAARLTDNVAIVSLGADTRQFLRRHNGAWFAPGPASYATLTQDAPRTLGAYHPFSGQCYGSIHYVPTRGWINELTFTLTNATGDVQTFASFNRMRYDSTSSTCAREQGFRLSNWAWPANYAVTLAYNGSSTDGSGALTSVSNTQHRTIHFINGGFSGFSNNTGQSVTIAEAGGVVTATDVLGAQSKLETTTLGQGMSLKVRLAKAYNALSPTTPILEYVYDTLARVSQSKDAYAIEGSRAPLRHLLANGLRGEVVNPLGFSSVTYADPDVGPLRSLNALGQAISMTFDGRRRVVSTIGPEGEVVLTEYDDRNRPTKVTRKAKPATPEASQDIVLETGWNDTWNRPSWTRDAKGAQTDYTYTSGLVRNVQHPAPAPGGTRFTGTMNWYSNGLLQSYSNIAGYQTSTGYDANGYLDYLSVLTNTWTVDTSIVGDPTTIRSPRGGAWNITYDALRRPTLQIAPEPNHATGSGPRVAQRTTYDLLGRVSKLERGTFASNAFTPLETTTYEYDLVGNRIKVASPASVVQTSYDALNRPVCTAVRMNPETWSQLPTNACVPATPGIHGPDRITRKVYDALGRVVQDETGVGTALQQATATFSFTPSGKLASLTDANGNRSLFTYDGFDRLKRLAYPTGHRGSGQTSTTDYEEYTYDVNGNRTSFRRRDGQVINYQYDALNRLTVKDLPGTTTKDVYYEYTNAGQVQRLRFGSPTADPELTFHYNNAGQLVSETDHQGRTLSHEYDNDGNRVRLTLPNYLNRVHWVYDLAGRTTAIARPGPALHQLINLETISYGPLNRRKDVTRANGVTTKYAYDTVGRLVGLSHSSGLPATDFTQNFSYNPVGQLVGQSQAGAPYVWSGHPTTTSNFTHDALNRDAAIANLPGGYDSRGNLTADGTRIFTYDIENRLTGVSGGSAPVSIDYDPLGRIRSVTAGSTATDFLYDGSRLVGEYAGGTTQQLRYYAHGPGVDDPVVWIETPAGTWNTQAQAIHFHKDRLGSVVATSNPSGQVTPFTYGPYGEPQSWAGSRFRYTGQIALPEAQLYHYKARVYDPAVGRFLQTDPIGYADGPNVYQYVGSDPIGRTDPTGQVAEVHVWGNRYLPDGIDSRDRFQGHVEHSSYGDAPSAPAESYGDAPSAPADVAAIPAVVVGGVIGLRACLQSPPCARALATGAAYIVGKTVVFIKPPDNARDPDGPKAPGKPGEETGFKDPKGGENWVPNPNGRGHGWEGDDSKVWVPSGPIVPGGRSPHGGPHWDVQDPRTGDHENVYPGGHRR